MNRFFGAILLVSGMSIGTGMLALPVVTSFSGFYPTLILLLVCWLFMATTGLMLIDVTIYAGANSNLITMSEKTLGKIGKIVSWFCYLFLFYSLQAAHIAASVPILKNSLPWLPNVVYPLVITLIFGGFIYAGTKATDFINRFVILGIVIGYGLLVLFAPSHVNLENLSHIDFRPLILDIPVVLISFGFQNIVPTLVTYLQGNRKQLFWAITIGSFLPLFLYAFWEFIVLGTLPLKGQGGLIETYFHGDSAATPLMNLLKTPSIQIGTALFSFCAILASFLGIGIALIDFLSDGLKLPKNKSGRAFSFLLAFLFPIIFVYLYPEGFLYALKFAGLIAVILMGIMPCLMTFNLRSVTFWNSRKGKIFLSTTLLFFLLVEIVMILLKLGFFQEILAPYI